MIKTNFFILLWLRMGSALEWPILLKLEQVCDQTKILTSKTAEQSHCLQGAQIRGCPSVPQVKADWVSGSLPCKVANEWVHLRLPLHIKGD